MPIPPGEFTIGRLEDSYVRVDDSSASRNHARLYNGWEGLFIEDVGSSNGTVLRGTFIKARTKLSLGDIVYVGSVPYRVDPEVATEGKLTAEIPEPRPATVGTITRATERIPAVGESPRKVEAIAPEKLSAPEVSSGDSDADLLNAVVMREPQAPLRAKVEVPTHQNLPPAKAGTKIKPKSIRIPVGEPETQPSQNVPRYPEPGRVAHMAPKIVPVPADALPVPRVPMPLTPQASLSPQPEPIAGEPVVKYYRAPLLPAFMIGFGIGLIGGFVLAWLLIKSLYLQ